MHSLHRFHNFHQIPGVAVHCIGQPAGVADLLTNRHRKRLWRDRSDDAVREGGSAAAMGAIIVLKEMHTAVGNCIEQIHEESRAPTSSPIVRKRNLNAEWIDEVIP